MEDDRYLKSLQAENQRLRDDLEAVKRRNVLAHEALSRLLHNVFCFTHQQIRDGLNATIKELVS